MQSSQIKSRSDGNMGILQLAGNAVIGDQKLICEGRRSPFFTHAHLVFLLSHGMSHLYLRVAVRPSTSNRRIAENVFVLLPSLSRSLDRHWAGHFCQQQNWDRFPSTQTKWPSSNNCSIRAAIVS
eukprot:scaffold145458_cov77-Cyclotella_meneghiniana.AAC.5